MTETNPKPLTLEECVALVKMVQINKWNETDKTYRNFYSCYSASLYHLIIEVSSPTRSFPYEGFGIKVTRVGETKELAAFFCHSDKKLNPDNQQLYKDLEDTAKWLNEVYKVYHSEKEKKERERFRNVYLAKARILATLPVEGQMLIDYFNESLASKSRDEN